MLIRCAIRKVAAQPVSFVESWLVTEQLLKEMVIAARLLSEEWISIRRQGNTGFGGRIDLLAVAPEC